MSINKDIFNQEDNKRAFKINNISFTDREMDVISCIISGKTADKEIASLLHIGSSRTVENYKRTIRQKINCNIQKFFEKTDKYSVIRSRYIHLLFVNTLQKIFPFICKESIILDLYLEGNIEDYMIPCGDQHKNLQEYLTIVGFTVVTKNIQNIIDLKDENFVTGNKDTKNHALIILSKDSVFSNLVDRVTSINKLVQLLLQAQNKIIFLGLDEILTVIASKLNIPTDQIIKISQFQNNFYITFFELLNKLGALVNPKVEQYILSFKDNCNNDTGSPQITNHKITPYAYYNNKLPKLLVKFSQRGGIKYLVLVFIIICVLAASLLFYPAQKEKVDITKINQSFAEFITKFSGANIISDEQKQLNYSLMNKVEGLTNLLDERETLNYFLNPNLPEVELFNCLYVLHALSNQYTFHKHDGEKARKIILIAKQIAEAFLQNKSNLPINFDELTDEELYAELNMIKDMPEMYIRILYILGRSYVYQGDMNDSLKYFKRVSYLGKKLSIFEGFMAIMSGLEFLKNIEIEKHIQNLEYHEAKKKIFESIKTMQSCLDDNKEYKLNYRPSNNSFQTIIPQNNTLNIVICKEKLIKHYTRLIIISNDTNENQDYVNRIFEVLFPKDSSTSLLEIAEPINSKTKNNLYNSLANSLLKMEEKQIDNKILLQKISSHLNLRESDNLKIIEHLFDYVMQTSKNTDYLKAEAYDGLIKIYQKQIKEKSLENEAMIALQSKIQIMTKRRDEINTQLKRSGWRLDQGRL